MSTQRRTLYHYTTAKGLAGIASSETLRPALKAVNPKDARYGDGQYLSDIVPGTKTPGQLAYTFLNDPRGWRRFTHYVEIDVTGLTVVEGRPGVLVIPNTTDLNLAGRIVTVDRFPGRRVARGCCCRLGTKAATRASTQKGDSHAVFAIAMASLLAE